MNFEDSVMMPHFQNSERGEVVFGSLFWPWCHPSAVFFISHNSYWHLLDTAQKCQGRPWASKCQDCNMSGSHGRDLNATPAAFRAAWYTNYTPTQAVGVILQNSWLGDHCQPCRRTLRSTGGSACNPVPELKYLHLSLLPL